MRTIVAPLLALVVAAPAAAQDEAKGIVEYVAETPNFQTLYSCLQASDLDEALQGEGPYTVFAPSDEAFAKLPKETIDGLLKEKEKLARILKYHVIPQEVTADDARKADGSEVKTLLEGAPLPVSVEGQTVMVGKAKVVKADVSVANGVIHVVDTVLMPPQR